MSDETIQARMRITKALSMIELYKQELIAARKALRELSRDPRPAQLDSLDNGEGER